MTKALIFLGILDDMDIEWIIRTGVKKSIAQVADTPMKSNWAA